MTRTHWIVVAVALSGLAVTADADIVEMIDGRVFEGEIVAQDDNTVAIDTQITPSIRTTLHLGRLEIRSIEQIVFARALSV